MKALRTRHGLFLFAAVALLVLIPLMLVSVPPMLDYPNHLARCAILAQLPHDPALAALYEPRSVLLPNMAMDAVVVPLAHIMPILDAGRVFCGLVLLTIFSGCFALSWSLFRRITLWSFSPALLLFNHIFTFGFLNYLFGIGLLLWGLAAWIHLREKHLAIRVAAGMLFALALFFSHLIALFLFGCALFGWEISHWFTMPNRKLRTLVGDVVVLGGIFLAPALLLLRSPTQKEASKWSFDSLTVKLHHVERMLRTDSSSADALFSYLVFAAVCALIVFGALKVERRMWGPILGITAAFLLLPLSFATCGCVDLRVPIAIALVFAAGTRVVKWNAISMAAAGVLMAAFGLRMTQVTESWLTAQRTVQMVKADFDQVPKGSVVFSAADVGTDLYHEASWAPPLLHLPLLEAVDRHLFFPQIFALPTQHPLAVRADLAPLQRFQSTDPKFFDGAETFDSPLDLIRKTVSDPTNMPLSLGKTPAVYIFALTHGFEPLSDWPDAKVVVQRERYAIYKLTDMDDIYVERERYWHPGSRNPLVAQRPGKLRHP